MFKMHSRWYGQDKSPKILKNKIAVIKCTGTPPGLIRPSFNAPKKHESTLLHKYLLLQIVHKAVVFILIWLYNKIFLKKTFVEVHSSHRYASFATFCAKLLSIIQGTVSLWKKLINGQIAVFEGKFRQFRNSSGCLKTPFTSNNWPIWTQKVTKEA